MRSVYALLFIIIILTEFYPSTLFGDVKLKKNAVWPYSSAAYYLSPAPNALAAVSHHSYPDDGILLFSSGDTINLYNATDMVIVGSIRIETPDIIFDYAYKDDSGSETIYIAAGDGGVLIYDISETASGIVTLSGELSDCPSNPGYKKNIDNIVVEEPLIDALGAGYHNNRLFLADDNFGLRVIDVSDPVNPAEVLLRDQDPANRRVSGYIQPNIYGSFDSTGGYTNLDLISYQGKTYALVLDYYYGLRVFDVTDPEAINAPVSKNLKTNILYGAISLVTDVKAAVGADSRLYGYVTAVDIYGADSVVSRLDLLSDSNNLEHGSITNIGRTVTPGDSCGVTAFKDLAYVADGDRGLQIVDLSSGTANKDGVLSYPVAESYELNIKGAMSVEISGNRIFMNDKLNGLMEIDISDSSSPSLVRTIESIVSVDSVSITGTSLCLLDKDDGLRMVDISNPSELIQKGFLANEGPAYDIHASGNYAYIANGFTGLRVIDISDPATPTAKGAVDTSGSLRSIDLYTANGSTFVIGADSTGGFVSVNVTDSMNPGTPVPITTSGFTDGTARDVYVLGDTAFLADGDQGLKIASLSSIFPFPLIGAKDTAGNAVAVTAFNAGTARYAIISDDVSGIVIEDVSDPSSVPDTLSITAPPAGGTFTSLSVMGNYLFASAGLKGIFIYDITDPSAPFLICSRESDNTIIKLFPFKKDDDVYIMAAESTNGAVNYRLSTGKEQLPSSPLNDSVDSGCFILTLF